MSTISGPDDPCVRYPKPIKPPTHCQRQSSQLRESAQVEPAISRWDAQYDMARYQLSTGEDLAPTGEPQTFRTADGKIVLTLIRN
jgi:hypothetical protein